MSEPIPSAGGRFSAFLTRAGERERSLGRLLLFVALAILLGFLACFVAIVVVCIVAVFLGVTPSQQQQLLMGGELEGRSLLSHGYEFAIAAASLFPIALVWIALAARLYRRPMRSFLTIAARFRWRQFGLGLAVAAPLVAIAVVAEYAWGGSAMEPPILRDAWPQAAGYAAIAAASLFLAALAEEMVFRGWLVQQTAAFTRSILIILIVNGVLFSLIHIDPNPSAFLVRAVMGAGWTWIALRLGGIEFVTGAHLANNLVVSLLAQPLTLDPVTETADPRSVMLQLAIVAVTVAAVEFGLNLNKRGRIAAPR